VCCSVLQCVAVLRELRACPMTRLDTLLPFAFLYTTAARTATDSNCNTRNTLQHTVSRTAVCCSVLQFVAVCCSALQRVTVCCNCCWLHNTLQQALQRCVLQRAATTTNCNTLQHSATRCNVQQLHQAVAAIATDVQSCVVQFTAELLQCVAAAAVCCSGCCMCCSVL